MAAAGNRIVEPLERALDENPRQDRTLSTPDGQEWRYTVAGDGPLPIVLLHGWGLSRRYWLPVVRRMAGSRWTIFAPDLPGFGESPPPAHAQNMNSMVNGVVSFVRALGLARVTLVGHSLGASIALKLAAEHPDLVDHLVLESVSGGPPQGPAIAGILEQAKRHGPSASFFEPALKGWFKSITPDDLKFLMEQAMEMRQHTFVDTIDVIMTAEGDSLAGRIQVPTLIIFGTHDRNRPFSDVAALNDAIGGSQLFVVERAAHTPHYDRPEKFTWVLKLFLDDALPTQDV